MQDGAEEKGWKLLNVFFRIPIPNLLPYLKFVQSYGCLLLWKCLEAHCSSDWVLILISVEEHCGVVFNLIWGIKFIHESFPTENKN